MRADEIEMGAIITLPNGLHAERMTATAFEAAWKGRKKADPGVVYFAVIVPDGKLDWYAVPGDEPVERRGLAADFGTKN